MQTVSIGGRRYSDPDIISLAQRTGALIDPRFTIRTQARLLLQELQKHDGIPSDPLERLKILASMNGIRVEPMDSASQRSEKRDAVLYPVGAKWRVLYNPNRPQGRILFTIAHEIIHTVFPNSSSGARFRAITTPSSREANELERLCDLGAAELVLPLHDFRRVVCGGYNLTNVERVAKHFGTSLEATAYRMASAHPGIAIAGLLCFRRKVGEDRALLRLQNQRSLFPMQSLKVEAAEPRYRRQSLHMSENCGDEYMIRWNKSFDLSSVVYEARRGGIVTEFENLPNTSGKTGRIDAMLNPYQRDGADAENGDVLFFWEELALV